ncbi:hypothetical protein EV383_4017 [Pseudonocardia sediminis]|uniref:Uncharacterized protein n=1 Tax=Pseudonocardia sediminis TaxID=1397368 RepID=A0A4V2FR44_PSEST|nr:hypothetical protein [Pseudonocardia sediminis]RZT87110.1 hypothetical protein EV383_4017 [Pseudonocardia sediminis]
MSQFETHPALRLFRVRPDHRRGETPLCSPFEPAAVPDSGLLAARCGDRRGHPVPDVDCGCGLTSTESPEALAIYSLAMEPFMTDAYDQAGALGQDASWLDQMAWCSVTAIGPHLGADEVEFDQSRALQLAGVWLPGPRRSDEHRITAYYGVPVVVSGLDGVDWLDELVPGFDRSGSYCVTCGRRGNGRGLCVLHYRSGQATLASGEYRSGVALTPGF